MSDNNPSTPDKPSGAASELYRLGVSRYDRTAGMLIALLILLGMMVFLMAAIWLTNRMLATAVAVPIVMEEVGDQEEDAAGPDNDDIEPPPPMETEIIEEEIEDVLEAVEDAMATRAAMLERGPTGEGTGKGGGGTGRGRKGRPRRWELRFREGNSLDTYAKQLDYFGIELGVLRPGNKVLYVSKLARRRPTTRTGSRDDEKRYRFTWTQGSLEQADRALLNRAGVEQGGSLIYKFLPPPLYQKLRVLEAEEAQGKKIRATIFGIKSSGSDHQFYVIRQSYR